MARHRKSRVNRVSVNPQSTERYVIGVLTGADDYITGLLSGTGMYDTWAQVESELEGTKLTEYKPDQMKLFLANPNFGPLLRKFYSEYEKLTPQEAELVAKTLTNYQRVKEVDQAMINAGKKYRDEYFENAYKSKNMQFGINKLESEGMKSGIIKDRVGSVLSRLIYNF